MLKRALALVLALVLCLGVLAGCGGEETPAPSTNAPTNAPTTGNNPSTDAPTTPAYTTPDFNGWKLTMYTSNNKDFDAEGCYGNTIVEKHLNMDWEIYELDNWAEQWNPMIAEKNIPSLSFRNSFSVEEMGQLIDDGAMIQIMDYIDQMPNVKAYLESDDPLIQADVKKYTRPEGGLYALPITQSGVAAVYGYFYRADLFEKDGLTFATTQDEFYNLLQTLKSKYPDSYPFVLRQLTGNMQQLSDGWGVTWGKYHNLAGYSGTFFTHDANGNYYMGQISDEYKEMAQYFVKLTNEGLLHPSSMTLDTAGWNEAFASGTSFISYDKMDRIPSIIAACVENIPGIRLVGAAPIAMGSNGTNIVKPLATTNYSWTIGDNADLENTLKFVDWLYSEEGITMTNWGVEGESYTVDANGVKTMNVEFLDTLGGLTLSGLNTPIICAYKDFDAYLSSCDADLASAIATVLPYQAGVPQVNVVFTDEEREFWDIYQADTYSYANAELSKFMLGQRDFSEWDAFKNELNTTYKLAEMQKLSEAAYARAVG